MKHGFTGCGAAKESREIDLETKQGEREANNWLTWGFLPKAEKG